MTGPSPAQVIATHLEALAREVRRGGVITAQTLDGYAQDVRAIDARHAEQLQQRDRSLGELARVAEQNRQRYEIAEAAQGGAVSLARTLQSARAANEIVLALVNDPRWTGTPEQLDAVREEHRRAANRVDLWVRNLDAQAQASGIPAWDDRGTA